MEPKTPKNEYDPPWKSILSAYFEAFMHFFFPKAAADIDWELGYESLETELESLIRRENRGNQIVDKLMKVWRLSGQEVWVLIHIEVQASPEPGFAERMYSYWSTIRFHYRADVFSCAILADDRPNWRPDYFETALWGTKNRFEFTTVKLLDYAHDIDALERSNNPFAQVVLAQLRTIQTSIDAPERRVFKFQLFRLLYQKGYSLKMRKDLVVFLDWVMTLSEELTKEYLSEITRYDEEQKMKYIPTWGRESFEEGRAEGREALQGAILDTLEARFGKDHHELSAIQNKLHHIEEIDRLRQLVPTAALTKSLTAFSAELD